MVYCEEGHETNGILEQCIVCKKWLCREHKPRSNHTCKQRLKDRPKPTNESLSFV